MDKRKSHHKLSWQCFVHGDRLERLASSSSLIQDEGTVEGHEQLKSYITKYYKAMFGKPDESDFSLDETRTDDIPQVSDEENSLLTAPYSEE